MIKQHPTLPLLCDSETGLICWSERGRSRPLGWYAGSKKKDGYLRVAYRGKDYPVHRIIAETFVENPDRKPIIDHVDRNRANNIARNLRWVTYSENRLNSQVCDDCVKKWGVHYSEDRSAWNKARLKDPETAERIHKWNRDAKRRIKEREICAVQS